MSSPPFVLFGAAHLATLAIIAVVSITSALVVRRAPDGVVGKIVCRFLAGAIVGALVVGSVLDARGGSPWTRWAPLQLCDVAGLLAAVALVTRRQRIAELVWCWALVGTLLASVTPDLAHGFPTASFIVYFAKHGLAIVGAVTAVIGLKLAPERGAPFRALGWTLAFAAAIGLLDLATGANIFYLRHKPGGPTVLDAFGPWPIYLVVTALFALVVFALLCLPFALQRRRAAASIARVAP